MSKRARIILVLCLCSSILLFSSCQSASEQEQFQLIRDSKSPQEKVQLAREFLDRFPDSKDQNEVVRLFFRSAVEANNGPVAEEAARAYLDSVAEKRRDPLRIYVARSLAEHGIALDYAESLAREAVEHARAENGSALAGYLDGLAFVLYRERKLEEAEQYQDEAVGLQDKRGDLIGRLALYQYEDGKPLQALENGSRAILLGDDEDAYQHLPRWALSEGPEVAEQVTTPLIEDFLRESDTPERKTRAALLLALAGIDLGRAESLAHTAINQLKALKPAQLNEVSDAEVNLAQVYIAQGRYSAAINTLASQQAARTPWDLAFWFAVGKAYRLSEQPEKARQALLQPLLVGDSELISSELNALGATDVEIQQLVGTEKARLESFDPGTYSGNLSETDRVPLVELFTGAECNPCQSADLAMDLVAHYYPRGSVAILEYHVHIPRPDPLTTSGTVNRYQYYGAGGTPTVWFDGTDRIGGGGPPILKKSMFLKYSEAVEKRWSIAPTVRLELAARREKDRVSVTVDADGSGASSPVSGTIRIALVEKSVDYEGGNGIRHHAYVVRDLSDPDAPNAQLKEGRAKVDYQIDLVQLEKDLLKYLDDFSENPPERYQGFGGFRSKPTQINRSGLSVVSWVEDRTTKEILQSALTDLN